MAIKAEQFLKQRGLPTGMSFRAMLYESLVPGGKASDFQGTAQQNEALYQKLSTLSPQGLKALDALKGGGNIPKITKPGTIKPTAAPKAVPAPVAKPAAPALPTSIDEINAAGMAQAGATAPASPLQKDIAALTEQLKAHMDVITKPETSFVEMYKHLRGDAGIPEIENRLVNLNNVIAGTENDIRRELAQTGGIADESQIQAMVASRNKTLITMSESLQAGLAVKNQYIDQIMSLEKIDREAANKKFEDTFGFQEKIANLDMKLETSGFKQTLQYMQLQERFMNDARTRVSMFVNSGAIAKMGDAELQHWADTSGIDLQDLKDMKAAVADKNDLKRQQVIVNIHDKLQARDDMAVNAQAVMDGTQAPPMSTSGLGSANALKLQAAIHRIDPKFNLKDAQRDWLATQSFIRSANSPTILRFQRAAAAIPPAISELRTLSDNFSRSGIVPLNKAKLTILANTGNVEASNFIAQAKILQDELGSVFVGGNSPTDKFLQQAQDILNTNYSIQQFNGVLDLLEKNVGYRLNGFYSLKPYGGNIDAMGTGAPVVIPGSLDGTSYDDFIKATK